MKSIKLHLCLLFVLGSLIQKPTVAIAQIETRLQDGKSVLEILQTQKAYLSRSGLTGAQLKKELLSSAANRLASVFEQHPSSDPYATEIFQQIASQTLEEQVRLLILLREKLRYDTQTPYDKNPKYDAVCKFLYIAEWDASDWHQAELLQALAELEAGLRLVQSTAHPHAWNSFGELLERLREYQPTADLAETVARGFVYPNFVISAPLAPLESVRDRSITRPINETLNKDKIRLDANGTAKVHYDAHFEDVNGVGNLKVDVHGEASNSLRATRKRISIDASLKTNINGSVYLPMTETPKEATNLGIENSLNFRSADFRTRIPVLNRIADSMILKIARRKGSDMEELSEREMEKFVRNAIAKAVLDGFAKARQMMTKYAEKNLVENGLRLAYIGTKIEQTADVKLYMDTNYGAPRLSPFEFEQQPLRDALVVRISEGLFSQFSDSMRGMKMRETDVRELCFEPLGLVPEFETPLVATVPYSLHLANSTPYVIRLSDNLVVMTFKCDAFDLGEDVTTGKFTVSASYRTEYPDDKLRLVRVGNITVDGRNETDAKRLEAVADRFFPDICNSSEIRLIDQLTQDTGVEIKRFEIEDSWLAIHVAYDANALLERVVK